MLKIECETADFSRLAAAFEGEFEADCNLKAEVVCVNEEEIKRLNREFRQVDAVTDVLSFPSLNDIRGEKLCAKSFPDEVEDGELFIGSIAICLKRAEEQAEEYGHSVERELNYLLAHGVFHLLGYDHIEESDKAEMREREERVMTRLNLKRGL